MLNCTKKWLALLLSACCLTTALTGCVSFRPAPGVGRDTTPSDLTDVTDTETAGTGAPDSTDIGTDSSAPNTTEPPETTPPPPSEYRVSVLAVGDNLIHESVYLDAKKRAADGAEYDFVPMYAPIADTIAAADIAFINQETPMAGKEYGYSGYPTFNSPREVAEALVEVGFDVVNLATNHLFDKHNAGAQATVEYMQSLPITTIGAYLNQEDYENIRVTEVNGIRIAWVSFSQKSNYAYNPAQHSVIMPMMNNDEAIRARVKAADQIADFVIVSAHWGEEVAEIYPETRRLASLIAEAGADVILGHHSHILQGVEWIATADGSRTLVAYSLGNFISTQYYAQNMVGGMLAFDIVMKDGVCRIESPILHPTVTQYSLNRDSLEVYLLEDYTEALAKAHGTIYHSPSFSLAWIYKHVTSIITDEFLPAYFE